MASLRLMLSLRKRGSSVVKCVLFDLDGTLADTYELILASQRYATRTVLGRVISDERLMATVGTPLADQMADYTDDPKIVDELCRVYREHNARVHGELLHGFDGVQGMLEGLKAAGMRMGVVTSKRLDAAQRAMDDLGIATFMECVVGGTDTARHKPHPDPVLRGCELMGLPPEDCIYVGDSPFDIRAGNAAGCQTIAVTWGMFNEGRLQEESPTYVAHEPDDVVGFVTR